MSRRCTYCERVVQLRQNILLVLDVINVLTLDDLVLLHGLYRVLFLGTIPQPAHLHKSKSACTIKQ